ncbi:hypothetical protein BCR33DRAFT_727908 [Rhizoclosmatium globosum]|uniref:WW domain-containing protein n=1 Tax=Rhizoclosmatium globosum TaxID=329046 RepID=A0A1Y2AMJ8_9FUNG|nr:hypothetical protein BCR33DRAFT_727908 [Rhizoclosmatium globosum]|eukprot:ORY23781.1 hypothetical protein BCR33DRAFT_727908 [Rhizoclosmatium globosum]
MGWSAAFDTEQNSYYYYNTETDETTWERPVGVEIEGLPEEADAKTATAGGGSGGSSTEDYYNSKEYYDWYYSQYATTQQYQQQHQHQSHAKTDSGTEDAAPGTAAAAAAAAPLNPGHHFAGAWNPIVAASGEELDKDFQPGSVFVVFW